MKRPINRLLSQADLFFLGLILSAVVIFSSLFLLILNQLDRNNQEDFAIDSTIQAKIDKKYVASAQALGTLSSRTEPASTPQVTALESQLDELLDEDLIIKPGITKQMLEPIKNQIANQKITDDYLNKKLAYVEKAVTNREQIEKIKAFDQPDPKKIEQNLQACSHVIKQNLPYLLEFSEIAHNDSLREFDETVEYATLVRLHLESLRSHFDSITNGFTINDALAETYSLVDLTNYQQDTNFIETPNTKQFAQHQITILKAAKTSAEA